VPETAKFTLITDTESLARACANLKKSDFITVDTEFVREKTYFPKLCLVQVAGKAPEDLYLIDPLAKEIDLAPLFGLLNDSAVLKVFHAADQDIEIFYHLSGRIPSPLFDTQIAAMVCGFGEAASYATLTKDICNEALDKSGRFTDWSRRPLSQNQMVYAASDVTYLRDIYRHLSSQLARTERTSWVDEEMAALRSPLSYETDPYSMWKKIRTRSNSPTFLHMVRAVAAWREIQAQRLDVPRMHLLKDQTLLEIVAGPPKTVTDLRKARGISRYFKDSTLATSLLETLATSRKEPLDLTLYKRPKGAYAKANAEVLELLKVLLKMKSEEHQVASRLIASSDDIAALCTKDISLLRQENSPLIHGWRYHIFGRDALALASGKASLKIKDNMLLFLRDMK
jgi:ribonuclease D